jgi:hypothetical protein
MPQNGWQPDGKLLASGNAVSALKRRLTMMRGWLID